MSLVRECPDCAEQAEAASDVHCRFCGALLVPSVSRGGSPTKTQRFLVPRIAIVAVAVGALGAATYFLLLQSEERPPVREARAEQQESQAVGTAAVNDGPSQAELCVETVNEYMADVTDGKGDPSEPVRDAQSDLGSQTPEALIVLDTYMRMSSMADPDTIILGIESACGSAYPD